MNLRPLLLALAASTVLAVTAAHAHDPSLHDDAPRAKAKPTTCEQLADTRRYSNDTAQADIKALKARCDAKAKQARTGTTGKAATPKP